MVFGYSFSIKRIKVLALVGESGTGKSFRAKFIAQKFGIEYIIDDGLLIKDNRIIAGRSAKTEKTFMAAVKVSLFDEKDHRDEIARRLEADKIRKILVLGTSEKMIEKIIARLQMPAPVKIIRIEDIANQEEIDKAIRTRRIEGKHVIPVPSAEIKRSYPNIFYNAIQVFRRRKSPKSLGPTPTVHEKSVVKPEFSRREKIIISEAALREIVILCVYEYNPNINIKKLIVRNTEMGYSLAITIDVPYGIQLGGKIFELQQHAIDDIERYTSILIEEVNIIIDKII